MEQNLSSPVSENTGKARFSGHRFRGKARFRGQIPPDDATVFTLSGKLDLEDIFVKLCRKDHFRLYFHVFQLKKSKFGDFQEISETARWAGSMMHPKRAFCGCH